MRNEHGSLEAQFQVSVDTAKSASVAELDFGSFSSVGNVDGAALPAPVIDRPYNTSIRESHTAKFQCTVQWRESDSHFEMRNW